MAKTTNNLPATIENDSPANVTLPTSLEGNTDLVSQIAQSESIHDSDFMEIQSGEFIKWAEGETMTLGFTGIEKGFEGTPDEKDLAVFYNKEGQKLVDGHTALVSKCKKIIIPEGKVGVPVRIAYLGKVKSATNPTQSYSDFRVGVL